MGEFATTIGNSVFLVVTTVFVELLLTGLAAYSLARLNPPGQNGFMGYMLVGSTLPIWLFLVPLFYMWSKMGLTNTLYGLAILYVAFNAPFATFLLRAFMVQIPRDFEDAARVDGANEVSVFTRVILPLTWPGFLTVGLVVGLGVWNEFQTALTLHVRSQAVSGCPELLQVHESLRARLVADQCRRLHDDCAGADPVPCHATPVHRRSEPGRD